MGISFTVLSSGSTGNVTVVRNGETALMIDAGLSAKRIDELLAMREMTGKEIDGILVTHEHSDHIKGLGAMARKYDLPIYANSNTQGRLRRA